jgi:ABC-type glutathione transport system ATPase component
MDKLINPTQGAGKRSPTGKPNKPPTGQSGFRHFVIPHVNGPKKPWELIEKPPSTLPERLAQSSQSFGLARRARYVILCLKFYICTIFWSEMKTVAIPAPAVDAGIMIWTCELAKSYGPAASPVHVVRGVTLEAMRGERVALLGKSVPGKSTLLNLLGGLDHATSGDYAWRGPISTGSPGTSRRRDHIQC